MGDAASRRVPRAASIGFLALALALAPAMALADTVVLKNGRRIDGKVLVDNDREVTIQTRSGPLMRFERREVASVERDATPGSVRQGVEEDLGAPEGASEDEVDRLRTLLPQLRDTAKRVLEARRDKEQASQSNDAARASLAEAREKELRKKLEQLKATREAIDRSAEGRLQKAQRAAKLEAEQLRADTERLRGAYDQKGLAERAEKLLARAPGTARDPRRAVLVGEAAHAMEAAAEVDLVRAKDAKTREQRTAALLRAAQSFAWIAANGEGAARAVAQKRAIDTYGDAHRSAGFRGTLEIERAILGIPAYKACAVLIEDRLGERRWGPELGENEAGQYKTELADGKVLYGDDAPADPTARSAVERRERTEQRTQQNGGKPGTLLVKATRWYELVWDPQKKRWARDSRVSQLEATRLVPLLRAAQERHDALARVRFDRDRAGEVVNAKRDAVLAVRRKADQGDATDEEVHKAEKDLDAARKALEAAEQTVAGAQVSLGEKQRELAVLDGELEKARKGE